MTREDRSSGACETMVDQQARRAYPVIRSACALISMMARSTCSNQRPNKMTQRPQQPTSRRTKSLCTTADYIWVKRVMWPCADNFRSTPHKQTIPEPVGRSKRCHSGKFSPMCIDCTTEL